MGRVISQLDTVYRYEEVPLAHCVPERFPRLCQAIFTVHIVFRGCIENSVPVWLIFE